jgi:small subunit ribosomal protein S6
MRRYETIVIINPDIPEDDRGALLNRIKEIIPQQEGVLIQEDVWGIRKLAYEIKKKPRGFYVREDYCGTGKVVDELERFCRIDDRVMKFLTVQLDPEADVEKIQAEIAAMQASAEQPAPAADATAPGTEDSESAFEEEADQATETQVDDTTPET